MHSSFILLNVLILILLFYYNKKVNLFIQPSVHFLLLNIISVFVCQFLIEDFKKIDDTIDLELFYIGIFLCSILSIVKIPRGITNKNKKEESQENFNFLKSPKFVKWVSFLGVVNLIFLIFFLMAVNLDVLMLNYKYLSMLNITMIGIAKMPLLVLYKKFFMINGLLSFFLYGVLTNVSSKIAVIPKWIYFCTAFFFWLYLLGNNSRTAGLIWVGLLGALLILEKKGIRKKAKLLLVFFIIGVSYMSAIFGRMQQKQGISQIPSNIVALKNIESEKLIFYTTNVFAGAWVFAKAQDLSNSYPEPYKYLSFSPFPSFLDNFSKYKKYENRITFYEPYSANAEVYHFGGAYILLYFSILTIGLRILNKAIKKNILITIILALPAYLFFISYQQYQLRNNFRFFFISIIACYIFINIKKNKK